MGKVRRNLVHGPHNGLTPQFRAVVVLGLAATVVFLGAMGSCDSEHKLIRNEEDLLEALIDSSTDFNRLLKWQAYDKMAMYVDPGERESFLMALDEIEGRINIESFEISHAQVLPLDPESPDLKLPVRKQAREGRVVVKLVNATFLPSTQVTTVRLAQDWIFKDETWYARVDLRELLQ
jgi:hypothetical protein